MRTNWTAQAQPQADPETLLNAYSNTGKGWTGGDTTYSVKLSGGRTVWIFSDTFLGPVNPDGSRPTTTPFINNSFVVQRGGSVKTVTGGTPANPTALVPPPANGWYWFGAAQTSNAGRNLDVVALRFEKTGTGSVGLALGQQLRRPVRQQDAEAEEAASRSRRPPTCSGRRGCSATAATPTSTASRTWVLRSTSTWLGSAATT